MRIPVAVVLLLDLLDIVWGNHLKDRQPCEVSLWIFLYENPQE